MRRALIPVLAIATLVTGGIGWTASTAASATAPTYSLTVAGTDMHSLDPHFGAMFVEGGGVKGVMDDAFGAVKMRVLEADLDLPVGARVTSIAITRMYCSTGPDTYVFGSYSPPTRNTLQTLTISAPLTCSPATLTKTGNPITTTVAGRRYALDFLPNVTHPYSANYTVEAFYGATLKYTCTSPCVP